MKTILVDAVDCFVSDTGKVNKEMHEMLDTFDNPKIIVTNAPDEALSQFGLDRVPYPVFSLKKDPLKTDPEYFNIFLKEKDLGVEDVIYFEHSLEAVESARSLGIDTYFYDHKKANIQHLSEFLDHAINNYDARKALLIAVNSDNEVLIQDRRNHKKPDWGYFGGGIEAGESSLEAVIRESKEELDLDISPDQLVYIGPSHTMWDGHSIMRYLYLYKTDQKDFTVLEGKGAHWMDYETARKHIEDEDRFDEMVERIEKHK